MAGEKKYSHGNNVNEPHARDNRRDDRRYDHRNDERGEYRRRSRHHYDDYDSRNRDYDYSRARPPSRPRRRSPRDRSPRARFPSRPRHRSPRDRSPRGWSPRGRTPRDQRSLSPLSYDRRDYRERREPRASRPSILDDSSIVKYSSADPQSEQLVATTVDTIASASQFVVPRGAAVRPANEFDDLKLPPNNMVRVMQGKTSEAESMLAAYARDTFEKLGDGDYVIVIKKLERSSLTDPHYGQRTEEELNLIRAAREKSALIRREERAQALPLARSLNIEVISAAYANHTFKRIGDGDYVSVIKKLERSSLTDPHYGQRTEEELNLIRAAREESALARRATGD